MERNRKRKRHPIPPKRRYRRWTIIEIAVIIALIWMTVKLLSAWNEPTYEIREDRVMTSQPVHVMTVPPEPTESASEPWVRYPVPLSDDLQRHIEELCGNDIEACVVMALIAVESEFDAEKEGDGGDSLGLMQINQKWHTRRMWRLGVFDLTDPYQNVDVGIDYLKELANYGNPIEWTLMAYNGGCNYADENYDEGIISEYASRIVMLSEEYLESAMVVT